MYVQAVLVVDLNNPVELQMWFDIHPTAVVMQVTVQNNVFYVFYK